MAAAAISGAPLRVRVESSGFLLRKREVSVLMAWASCFAAAALSSIMSRSQSRLNGAVEVRGKIQRALYRGCSPFLRKFVEVIPHCCLHREIVFWEMN